MRYTDYFKYAEDILSVAGTVEPLKSNISRDDNVFSFDNGQLSGVTEFESHTSGVIKRKDTLKNVSDKSQTLNCALSKFIFDGGEYRVYTEYSEWCAEGQGKWQDLVTEVSASNDDVRMNVGSTPFVAIYNLQTGRGVAFHILAESTWCFRVKKHYSQTGHKKQLTVELGIRERGFSYELTAGEALKLPEILFYEFKNTNDLDAYKLHRYYNDVAPARQLPIIYNSWMSRFDNISYDILSEQLVRAKNIGCDYFVIDAGWFGKPNSWASLVGDWTECEDYSMKGRMKEFADKVRACGLKFGLWFEIERAAEGSAAVRDYPQHYFKEGKHYFVNFASEDTCEYIFNKIAEVIRKYGIEFIKFDFNAEITFDSSRVSFIDYFKGYNDFISRLGKEFPSLYLQNCASGGLRMALSALKGFDSFWMSDNHSLYTQLEVFKSTLKRVPSRALEKWITVRSLEGFTPVYGTDASTEKILSSGDAAWGHMEVLNADYIKAVSVGGPIGISCDLARLSDKTLQLLEDIVSEYKNDSHFWISSECRILTDTDSLTVLQFSDSALTDIRIFTFIKVPHQNNVTVYPVCKKELIYRLDGTSLSGEMLDSDGISISLGERFTATSLKIKAE